MRRPFMLRSPRSLFVRAILAPLCGLTLRVRCGAMLSDDDISSSLEEPEAALAVCAEHRHAYLQCPWPRFGMRCLIQVPVPISLVDQFGPMYVCFLPEQDMAESPTSQFARSERISMERSGPRAFVDRVEAQERGTVHLHSLVWQSPLPSVDVGDFAPSALATNEHSAASSAALLDYVSGYCCMRDPGNRGGGEVTGVQEITQEEDLA